MTRFLFILLGIASLFTGLTYLLWRVSPRVKLVKYLPALFCLFAGGYYLYLGKTVHVGFQDLAYIILAMIFLTGFFSGSVTGLIIDFMLPTDKS